MEPVTDMNPSFMNLIGESAEMRQVAIIIQMVAERRATVLITGETGTGKEMAARALHMAGSRRGPMVAVNCSAIPANLLETELFGHIRGAFTGAVQSRIGRFEQAHNGTLFLDEIGDLPMDLQAKLLRVLQEREFQRLGSSETVKVDVRVVAATNCNLGQRVADGKFREDLFYRLNVVPVRMPPLRERFEDIPALAAHFVEKICHLEHLPLKVVSPHAVAHLCGYSWPGNVRQLENAVEMAVALSGGRIVLDASDFPLPQLGIEGSPPPAVSEAGLNFESAVAQFERNILSQAIQKTGGNKKAAAEMLGLKRTTLSAKVRTLEAAGHQI
jgi:DNA-binding NtrC family response regulator